jgi:hypothetical protein
LSYVIRHCPGPGFTQPDPIAEVELYEGCKNLPCPHGKSGNRRYERPAPSRSPYLKSFHPVTPRLAPIAGGSRLVTLAVYR